MTGAGLTLLLVDGEASGVQRVTIAGKGTLGKIEDANMEPVTILAVGVDNASGLQEDDSVLIGRNPTSMLTDTILLVRIDPQTEVVNVMSVPRDLWVTIAGVGEQGKINSAMAAGGPSALVGTIYETFGIEVNHFVQVNFAGFANAVDALGGVPLLFDAPARDLNSGLAVPEPGCFTLNGRQALSFVRSRYYEAQQDGVWSQDPLSDRSRVERQQVFVRGAVAQAVRQGARNPLQLRSLFDSVKNEVVLDDTLSLQTLISTADRVRGVSDSDINFFTLPTVDGWAGAASVAYLEPAEAEAVVAAFLNTSVPPPDETPVETNTPVSGDVAIEPALSPFVPQVPTTQACVPL